MDNSLGKSAEPSLVAIGRAVLLFSELAENVSQAANLLEVRQPEEGMTRFPGNTRNYFGLFAVLLNCCLLVSGCVTTPPPSTNVTQVILLWLKHPERQADRAQLRRSARSLSMIPGVRRVETRRTVPELPPAADRSFDLAVVVTFSDRAALQRYRNDPRHREAIRSYLRPLVRHYEVYNLSGAQE